MRYHLGLGVGHPHAHLSTSSNQLMTRSMDAQDEPAPESLSIGRDAITTDVADDDDDDDDDESDNSEMGLEDREGLDDVESDDSSDGGNNYGSQPIDAALVAPIFFEDEIVAYTALKAHMGDLGARDQRGVGGGRDLQPEAGLSGNC